MRALVAYAVVVSIAVVALALNLDVAHRRIAALERQLAPAGRTVAAVKPDVSRRSFTAHDGTVLNAADLAEADAIDARASKAAAQLEYMVKKSDSRSKSQPAHHVQP
jgi:hypothetical protein